MANNRSKPLILIVDDIPNNIDVLVAVLKEEYEIKASVSGEKALKIAAAEPKPDMILLDVMMPNMDGFEVCRRLKEMPATENIPVIFVTGKNEICDEEMGFKLGAVDYIVKPISPPIVKARVKTHIALCDQNIELTRKVLKRTEELNQTRLNIIHCLGRAAEFKDNETGLHVIRMSHYARLIAKAYGGNECWVEMVFNAAPMHDVGKIGIPEHILCKPGKLNSVEWDVMKKHCQFGVEIIGDTANSLLKMARTIAITHHEKWDGSGYPYGISGKDIAIEGRIVAVADVFDALTSKRPYKRAWAVNEAVDHIISCKGSHFDPSLIDIFLEVLPQILTIKEMYAD